MQRAAPEAEEDTNVDISSALVSKLQIGGLHTDENCDMLLLVEWKWVQPFENAFARNQDRHGFTQNITDQRQENDGHINTLRLEEVNCS